MLWRSMQTTTFFYGFRSLYGRIFSCECGIFLCYDIYVLHFGEAFMRVKQSLCTYHRIWRRCIMMHKNFGTYLVRLFTLLCVYALCFPCSDVWANRKPEFTQNLGGMPISCSIYRDQASLNGIKCGDSVQKVTEILGKPMNIINNKMLTYLYKGLTIKFLAFGKSGEATVWDMEATKAGDVSTMNGVKPGMSENALLEVYGTADVVHVEKTTAPKLSEEQNEKYRKRADKTVYTYYANPCLTLSFIVKEGVISSIQVHQAD